MMSINNRKYNQTSKVENSIANLSRLAFEVDSVLITNYYQGRNYIESGPNVEDPLKNNWSA